MLILTRSIGQAIYIDDDKIEVRILRRDGNQIRIGVSAPKNISVHRKEIYERIKKEEGI